MIKDFFSEDWYEVMKPYLDSKELLLVLKNIVKERVNNIIYPNPGSGLLFKVFRETPFNNIKVVILGQDIYHDGSYDGLAFSNTNTKKLSPSLRNILLEVKRDIYPNEEYNLLEKASLYRWAEQGVFLVNTSHTVIKGKPGSHIHYWEDFTSNMINALNTKENLIWMLWGNYAINYLPMINSSHYIITSGHPSPLNTSNPFIGNGCFSKCNEFLKGKNLKEIIW